MTDTTINTQDTDKTLDEGQVNRARKIERNELFLNLYYDDIDDEFIKKLIRFNGSKWWLTQSNGTTGFCATGCDGETVLVNIDHRFKDQDILFGFQVYLYAWDVYQLNGYEHNNTTGSYVFLKFMRDGKVKVDANHTYISRWFEKDMKDKKTFQAYLKDLPEKTRENRIHIRKVIERNRKILGTKEEYTRDEIFDIFEKISYT